eukprot:GILI01028851.1.p1 GENE.GILI01028851.1~~GILI01028851.1.p1  ORF type:complete len:187 (+),score=11.72 GILI01028851.1:36-563(+)
MSNPPTETQSAFSSLVPNRGNALPPPRALQEDPPSTANPPPLRFTSGEGIPTGPQIRYGDADLRPAGSVPMGGGGGMLVGPNHPMIRDMINGDGRMTGPGVQDPAAQYARYYPVAPGDAPRGGRGAPRGAPPGFAFGEPDPDHLPPFDPRGNTGGAPFRGGRGRGFGGYNGSGLF